MSSGQQEKPSTYRHHQHIDETLELFSGSSSSDRSEELCALKAADSRGGSSVDEKIDNPWAAPPTQPSSQPPPAWGVPQTTVNHGAPNSAHEAWLPATKRWRLSAAAATAQAMRRARLASLPADPYAWYASRGGASGRRTPPSSPTCFDSVYDSYAAAIESDQYLLMNGRADSDSQHLLGGFAMPPPYEPILGRFYSDDESLASSSVPGPVVSPASPPRSRRSVAQLTECFSRKVFVGGLPPNILVEEIHAAFGRFGALFVYWPHKANSTSLFPPKGYAFLRFRDEFSVQKLIASCVQEDEKLFYFVRSGTVRGYKQVHIHPWCLADTDFVMDRQQSVEPRKTVFVRGVPRTLRSSDLATIMNGRFGDVCYARIDVDKLKCRTQMCDICNGSCCGGKFAPFFCYNVGCLHYYCKHCWAAVHSVGQKQDHKQFVKEFTERPRICY